MGSSHSAPEEAVVKVGVIATPGTAEYTRRNSNTSTTTTTSPSYTVKPADDGTSTYTAPTGTFGVVN